MFFDKHHFFLKIFRSYHKALLKKFTFSFYLIRYYDWCWMSQTPFWAIHKSNLVLRKKKKKLDKTISNCMKTKCYTRSNLFKYKILSSKLVALLTHVPPPPLTPLPPFPSPLLPHPGDSCFWPKYIQNWGLIYLPSTLSISTSHSQICMQPRVVSWNIFWT